MIRARAFKTSLLPGETETVGSGVTQTVKILIHDSAATRLFIRLEITGP